MDDFLTNAINSYEEVLEFLEKIDHKSLASEKNSITETIKSHLNKAKELLENMKNSTRNIDDNDDDDYNDVEIGPVDDNYDDVETEEIPYKNNKKVENNKTIGKNIRCLLKDAPSAVKSKLLSKQNLLRNKSDVLSELKTRSKCMSQSTNYGYAENESEYEIEGQSFTYDSTTTSQENKSLFKNKKKLSSNGNPIMPNKKESEKAMENKCYTLPRQNQQHRNSNSALMSPKSKNNPTFVITPVTPKKKKIETNEEEELFNDVSVNDLYQGMWDCVPDEENELPFKRGQVIHIISREYDKDGWWIAKRKNKIGFVPKNYLMEAYKI